MKLKFKLSMMVFALLCFGCSKDPVIDLDQGAFTDLRDNHIYKWIRIGEQVWMAENLAYLPEVSKPNTGSISVPHYYVYGYENTDVNEVKSTENYITFGVLYNWPAIMDGTSSSLSVPSGIKGICPIGWHVPSDEEWKILEKFLGMSESEANSFNAVRGSGNVDRKLTSEVYGGWYYQGRLDNSSGFSAFPGGYRDSEGDYGNEAFKHLFVWAKFWTATDYEAGSAWDRDLYFGRYGYYGVGRDYDNKSNGFSVRCLKDD